MACANGDGSDDVSHLENKVVYAMSRLQKNMSSSRNKRPGVGIKEIVDYLMKKYEYLDGDVESQVEVITALLSCIKIGFVCAQDNGKFLLVGANPRLMTSNCLTRFDHGSRCSCLHLISTMTKMKPNNCCTLSCKASTKKAIKPVLKRTAGTKAKAKPRPSLKGSFKPQSSTCEVAKRTCSSSSVSSSPPAKKPKKVKFKCPQKSDLSDSAATAPVTEGDAVKVKKCSYCLRTHMKAAGDQKSCKKCFPLGSQASIPTDKFSPREEVM